MCMSQERKEHVYSLWDSTDEDKKYLIINEFRIKHRGSYTQQIFLTFLEDKLLQNFNEMSVLNRT